MIEPTKEQRMQAVRFAYKWFGENRHLGTCNDDGSRHIIIMCEGDHVGRALNFRHDAERATVLVYRERDDDCSVFVAHDGEIFHDGRPLSHSTVFRDVIYQ